MWNKLRRNVQLSKTGCFLSFDKVTSVGSFNFGEIYAQILKLQCNIALIFVDTSPNGLITYGLATRDTAGE